MRGDIAHVINYSRLLPLALSLHRTRGATMAAPAIAVAIFSNQ